MASFSFRCNLDLSLLLMTFKKKGLPHPSLVFGLLWFLATSDWVFFYVLGLVALICGAGLLRCSLATCGPCYLSVSNAAAGRCH